MSNQKKSNGIQARVGSDPDETARGRPSRKDPTHGKKGRGTGPAPPDPERDSLASLGEFGLIRELVECLGDSAADVLLPVGDDAALWDPGVPVLATADALQEGVHFRTEWGEPGDLGFKSMSVNVSDIAAMGGTPRLALVVLGAPAGTDPDWLRGLYGGMADACVKYDMKIGGGDTFISERVTLALTVLGTPPSGGPVTRAGARVGDLLFVTGTLGDAAAGVAYLKARQLEGRLKGKARKADRGSAKARMAPALSRALRPVARLKEGVAAAAAGVSAMIDISDGLAADLLHLTSASGVGVRLRGESIPIGSGTKAAESLLGIVPERLALSGGEDYELLMTVRPDRAEDLVAALRPTGTSLTLIGEILDASAGCFLEKKKKKVMLDGIGGFDHFKRD